ncbi:hypothetical protein RRG08_045551 [Elysia crispata]|uniref:Uncharacterized protein n=1 Tax=Elysia crispata TaxID=231223 RepID=A0AAE1DXM5_9GAST|nr:hypothetical protein RRG08_045551 [Elysia crispata]
MENDGNQSVLHSSHEASCSAPSHGSFRLTEPASRCSTSYSPDLPQVADPMSRDCLQHGETYFPLGLKHFSVKELPLPSPFLSPDSKQDDSCATLASGTGRFLCHTGLGYRFCGGNIAA